MGIIELLCQEFSIAPWQAENLIKLVDEGNTLPFIARYRKEQHGSLDDQELRKIVERLNYLRALDKRREEITAALTEQGVLDEALQISIAQAKTQSELEDIYRPYRPKRRTRASIAKERGLEPLAEILFAQEAGGKDVETLAAPYVDPEKEVPDVQAALAGAQDILAERFSEDADLRKRLRRLFWMHGRLQTRAAKEEDSVYRMYYEYGELMSSAAGHRILAINRGEAEGFLKVEIAMPEDTEGVVVRSFAKAGGKTTHLVEEAAADAYKRLIFPSLEREMRQELTDNASEAAMSVFALNLRNLLMQPPVKGKTVLALDPGIRTGCKVAVVDEASKVLHTGVIYPLPTHGRVEQAKRDVLTWIDKYHVDVIAIGNGTASRETEQFVADSLREMPRKTGYTVVNEAGASVYSASPLAAEEFPQMDVSLRSAVSIARRLQDPLAELVKIDPKSIGVGQYQHDMKSARLDETLGGVVEDCVNGVGVDVNTASPALLSYVAGIGPQLAKNIVEYRGEIGKFQSRKELKKVKKLGPKAFEQCAGFLRIPEAKNPLDASAVHPESYTAAEKLVTLLGIKNWDMSGLKGKIDAFPRDKLAEELGIGLPTLADIEQELQKPGRDPREDLTPVLLRTDVLNMEDLKPGMELTGTVRNVVDFGAFVDIGVHRDGLVHISRMAMRRINHPSEVVKVGDVLTVYVTEVNVERNQIGLSMLPPGEKETEKH